MPAPLRAGAHPQGLLGGNHRLEAAFSLLYLNPPYDWDAVEQEEQEDNETPSSRKNRLEYNFLRESYSKLQPGGVLVYVIPHKILGVERRARWPTTSATSPCAPSPMENTTSSSSA